MNYTKTFRIKKITNFVNQKLHRIEYIRVSCKNLPFLLIKISLFLKISTRRIK